MKVTVTGLEPQKKEIDWTKQCLVRSIVTDSIVMVTGNGVDKTRFSGAIIHSKYMEANGNTHAKTYDNGWYKDQFELLPENVELTLSNKSE